MWTNFINEFTEMSVISLSLSLLGNMSYVYYDIKCPNLSTPLSDWGSALTYFLGDVYIYKQEYRSGSADAKKRTRNIPLSSSFVVDFPL